MALIFCPECEHQISNKIGTNCPECGYPVTTPIYTSEEKIKIIRNNISMVLTINEAFDLIYGLTLCWEEFTDECEYILGGEISLQSIEDETDIPWIEFTVEETINKLLDCNTEYCIADKLSRFDEYFNFDENSRKSYHLLLKWYEKRNAPIYIFDDKYSYIEKN